MPPTPAVQLMDEGSAASALSISGASSGAGARGDERGLRPCVSPRHSSAERSLKWFAARKCVDWPAAYFAFCAAMWRDCAVKIFLRSERSAAEL